jgi:hypothetical protein
MGARRKYLRKRSAVVTAVRLDLDTGGFTYRKWGDEQRCKRGDWIVDSDGDVHTVNGDVFARTYRRISTGVYLKITPIWAEVATSSGSIETKEGLSHYAAGDYLVFNEEDGEDGYCVKREKFEAMYDPAS